MWVRIPSLPSQPWLGGVLYHSSRCSLALTCRAKNISITLIATNSLAPLNSLLFPVLTMFLQISIPLFLPKYSLPTHILVFSLQELREQVTRHHLLVAFHNSSHVMMCFSHICSLTEFLRSLHLQTRPGIASPPY